MTEVYKYSRGVNDPEEPGHQWEFAGLIQTGMKGPQPRCWKCTRCGHTAINDDRPDRDHKLYVGLGNSSRVMTCEEVIAHSVMES